MKTISSDRTWIDYTSDRVGVRVRPNSCRPIILERGRWAEYAVSHPIPVDAVLLRARSTVMSSLANNLASVEAASSGSPDTGELRQLITGKISFEDVLLGTSRPA